MKEMPLKYKDYTVVKWQGDLWIVNANSRDIPSDGKKRRRPLRIFDNVHYEYQLVKYVDSKVEHVVIDSEAIVRVVVFGEDDYVNAIMGSVFEMGEHVWVFEYAVEPATMQEVIDYRGVGMGTRIGIV